MCGGSIEVKEGASVGVCDYCGTQQTLPRLDDDRRANLYDRANHFRRNNEFDKATGIYEQILNEDKSDAEAYWSLVLCRYGIEYVEDPATHKRVPTVNRTQFTSIFNDDDYKSALRYADGYQRAIYEKEANAINEIQKGILAISRKEEPFDVFICYKETDHNGRRTPDSVLANDLYHQLTQEGFKVFFSRITLEDKLGTAYEPYIFAALNSAKVMVVLGTKQEHFNSVWVKNEWSRYLSLVKQSGGKKVLIPAYKDMDPYDLPDEFSHLQAQDMSKLGFMQDLIRGIKKITQQDNSTPANQTSGVSNAVGTGVKTLLKRVFIFLEDGNWEDADAYCERILDQDPENAWAYLGKLMAELRIHRKEDLAAYQMPLRASKNYQKVVRYGSDKMKDLVRLNERNEKRVFIFLEDGNWEDADSYCGRILEKDPENAWAYLGKLMAQLKIRRKEDLSRYWGLLSGNKYYQKVVRYGGDKMKDLVRLNERNEKHLHLRVKNHRYEKALELLSEGNYYDAHGLLKGLDYQDSTEQAAQIKKKIHELKVGNQRPGRHNRSKDRILAGKECAIPMGVVRIEDGFCYNRDNRPVMIIGSASGFFAQIGDIFGGRDRRGEISSVTIPDSVTKIGDRAFLCCSSLTKINIPESVREISEDAFGFCSSLVEITIPNSVTKIGDLAFSNCSSLTKINIPNSVTEIACAVFAGCSSLEEITIPNSVTKIGRGAFSNCSSLGEITIPNSVPEIGASAFCKCYSLAKITIPNSVTKIGEEAFSDCLSLIEVSIPESVREIGENAFLRCTSLDTVYAPKHLDLSRAGISAKIIRY